jgi:hypothetical protein
MGSARSQTTRRPKKHTPSPKRRHSNEERTTPMPSLDPVQPSTVDASGHANDVSEKPTNSSDISCELLPASPTEPRHSKKETMVSEISPVPRSMKSSRSPKSRKRTRKSRRHKTKSKSSAERPRAMKRSSSLHSLETCIKPVESPPRRMSGNSSMPRLKLLSIAARFKNHMRTYSAGSARTESLHSAKYVRLILSPLFFLLFSQAFVFKF